MPRKQTPIPAPFRSVYVAILLPVGVCVLCIRVYARVNVCVFFVSLCIKDIIVLFIREQGTSDGGTSPAQP